MFGLKFKEDDNVLYEDERVAVELGNGEHGPTIYVINKLPGEEGVLTRRFALDELLEVDMEVAA